MPYALTPHIAFAFVDHACIVLDTSRDRYFRLSANAADALRTLCAGDTSAQSCTGLAELVARGFLIEADAPGRIRAEDTLVPPVSALELPPPQRRITPPRIAFAFRLAEARLRLRFHGLAGALAHFRRTELRPAELDRASVLALVQSCLRARAAVPLAQACLPDSLALATLLRRRGVDCRLVIGVKDAPFGAHAWVQSTDHILSDDHASVADFVPILAL